MTITDPNKKGAPGEIAVCKELLKLGYDVFVQIGNHSKIDLIVLNGTYKPFKIQIKTVTSSDGIVEVHSVKRCLNPNYDSTYTIEQVDVFAVYVIDHDSIFYVTAKELLVNGKTSKFRLSKTRNGQAKFVRYVDDYLSFEKALRDCTPHALTASAVGDETVQTTTPGSPAAGESQCGR